MAKTNSGLLEFKDAQKVLIVLDDATSEVKKAVVIDADGVETDIQGVQPTGKKEITSTEEVNVANYATAQVVDEDLVAGNIKKDVDILGVVGSYEAPASDFSTAKLTIVSDDAYGNFYCPILMTSPIGTSLFPVVSSTGEYDIVIYSSGTVIMYAGEANPTVTGNIQAVGENTYLITGNGTITIS